jgi:hypothetical protein
VEKMSESPRRQLQELRLWGKSSTRKTNSTSCTRSGSALPLICGPVACYVLLLSDIVVRYEHGGYKGDVSGGRLRLPYATTSHIFFFNSLSAFYLCSSLRYKTLPFHCCALTLQDFKDAM